jgi:2-amino-4-hydroxy-6-hydroxymethyldihydropteridine diphosphokinase
VVVVKSKTPLNSWLEIIHEIEYTMGRRRQADRNAPRPIDIDLLYAGDRFLDDEHLTVPHPRWQERAFVVIPLADVRPNLVLPGAQQSVGEIRQQLSEPCGVRLFKESW